jgi:hypothetical protein
MYVEFRITVQCETAHLLTKILVYFSVGLT